jgi:small conductance mechanosensitive channel
MPARLSSLTQSTLTILSYVALKVLGAILLWFAGRWLIRLGVTLLGRALERQNFDRTIAAYIRSGVGILLNIVLLVALLGFFGVETTTFAALLAGVGIAVGVAWSGLLSNFAAGIFLVSLRPFQVGNVVSVAGITGTVRAIGLFGTTLDTADNIHTIIGNGKIFSEIIQNFSANEYRRVDLEVQLAHDVDPRAATMLLQNELRKVPNVLANPAPDVVVLKLTLAGPLLAVRPYCENSHYWQVYFDVNRLIVDSFRRAGYPVPEQHYAINGNLEMAADEIVVKAA